MDEDEAKLLAAAQAFREAIDRINDWHIRLCTLRKEATALVDRFALQMPDLPPLTYPDGNARWRACVHADETVLDLSNRGSVRGVLDGCGGCPWVRGTSG